MKLLKENEFVDKIDYYCDLVHDRNEVLMVRLNNGSFIYVKPVEENEIR